MFTKYTFELNGEMPLLMHRDSVEEADRLSAWRKDPTNKNFSVAGDDRSPAWTWQTYLYNDGAHVVMPAENIMVALRHAGTQLILKRQKTFKEISQSGLLIGTEFCDFLCDGKQIALPDITKVMDWTFAKQSEYAQALGFHLFCKRAVIGRAKHIRVRPRFDSWSVRGSIAVTTPEITSEILSQLFDIAGRCGLGDWRPACKTPGPYGMFTAQLKKG